MCPKELIYLGLVALPRRSEGILCPWAVAVILLIFVFSLAFTSVFAQKASEEYLAVKNWQLPADAVPFSELKQNEQVYLYRDKPFTGISYERYPMGQLLRSVSYLHGKQSGVMMLWYPDGAPQMSANYINGYLHGRFLGWYGNGGVIYDMVLNKGTYSADSLVEADDSRASSEATESEGEGPDNDNSPE